MKLHDIFGQYTKDELKIMCINMKISGYGGLDKQELVELLCQSMSNKEFVMELFKSLSDFCTYFLSLVPKMGREEIMDEMKALDVPSFSLQAINDSIKKFYIVVQIFLRESDNRNAILTIPDDIMPFYKEFLKKNQARLDSNLMKINRLFKLKDI